jgi:glucose-1-phosphate adenylyltransferase
MLAQHEASGADVTVGCIEVPRMEATAFGVMHVDGEDRVTAFLEKPADPPGMPDKPDKALASMGIYVFNTDFLARELRRDAADAGSSHDFGKDMVPYIVQHGHAVAHRFTDSCVTSGVEEEAYWRDVGTVDAYWQANIDLTDVVPSLNLYDREWPIWTYSELTPPAKFVFDDDGRRGTAVDSLVSGGCIVSGSRVARSVLSNNARVHSFCEIEGGVLLPDVIVNRNVRLKNVVVDSGVRLPDGLVVGEDPEEDARRFRRSAKGVTLITQPMIDALAP